MSSNLGIFSFNVAQIESSIRGKYRSVQPYENPVLRPDDNGLSLTIELPKDARIGDKVEVILTKLGERVAKSESVLTVDADTYLTKIVDVKIQQPLEADRYAMQINLVGLHDYLKNTAEFTITLAEALIAPSHPEIDVNGDEVNGAKRLFNAAMSAVLSVF
ncbi:hypothetical protein HUZ36_05695 [Pseudoalteromonas sp. McH1-7]|uniref:hypothetical protein n=1 Tax=Pseudoalteromonas TaxID=53246 RepID=UPI0015920DC1|nr:MULTISPECIES: hypothetical protein [Pseudoalteromonas]MDW7548683.1 hypothetical protein [Pseudoalteromonas peptidolytica]NUZ10270.1 hypothetical protein [Pseudoalteromonas sp. McH1-7]